MVVIPGQPGVAHAQFETIHPFVDRMVMPDAVR